MPGLTSSPMPSPAEIDAEAARLLGSLMHVECDPSGKKWNYETCRAIAPLTLEINRLKKEKDAVILTHSYDEPEIVYGVGDFKGDSYFLSLKAKEAKAKVCVTSGNVYDIVSNLPAQRILFVPDRLMADNVRSELKRRGVTKEIISSDGTCMVHDEFTAAQVHAARAQFPGLKVVAHPECTAEVAAVADFVGSTGAMMKYVKTTPAPYFLMLTECGLVGRLEVESPEKHFIGGCRLCPYMKLNSLEKIRDALRAPRPDQIVTLDESLRLRAAKCIDRMFELTPGD